MPPQLSLLQGEVKSEIEIDSMDIQKLLEELLRALLEEQRTTHEDPS